MAYFRCGGGGIPSSIKTDMNAVLNKKFGTQSENYPPTEWADDVNLMGLLPIRTASGTIAHFEDGADSVPMKSIVANITPVQSGSGTPSPSNPRPISGTDELTLIQTGANLIDPSTIEVSGTIQVRFFREDNILLKKGVTYKFVYLGTNQATLYFAKPESGTYAVGTGKVLAYTPSEDCYAWLQAWNLQGIETDSNKFVLTCDGSEPTTYEPYNAETYTIDLGQEIMGGSAEVVGGEGEVTHVVVTYDGTEDWHSEGTNNFYVDSGRGSGVYYGEDKLLCSHFKSTYSSLGHNNNVYISATGNLNLQCDDITHTADGIKTWCATQYANGTPLQICYELKTSTEYTFTGQPINSYLGTNNLYVDSGEVLDVEYRADIDLLIAELEG